MLTGLPYEVKDSKTPEERDLRARILSDSGLELTSGEDTAAAITKVPQWNGLCHEEKNFGLPHLNSFSLIAAHG